MSIATEASEVTEATTETKANSIWDSAVCLCLVQSKPTVSRALKDDEYEVDADKDRTSARKKILDCVEYDMIGKVDRAFKAWLAIKALPTELLRSAMFPVSIPMVAEVDNELESYKAKRRELVDEFIAVYPDRVQEQQAALRSNFNASDYPFSSEMREAFSVSSHWVTFSTPASLKKIKATMFDDERAKMASSMEVASKKMEQAMAVSLKELTSHLAFRLTDSDDGKKRVLRESAVEKIREFLDTFRDRNITNDSELQEVVEKAESVLSGVSADSIRKDVLQKQTVQEEMAGIAETLNGMIEERGRRIILE